MRSRLDAILDELRDEAYRLRANAEHSDWEAANYENDLLDVQADMAFCFAQWQDAEQTAKLALRYGLEECERLRAENERLALLLKRVAESGPYICTCGGADYGHDWACLHREIQRLVWPHREG